MASATISRSRARSNDGPTTAAYLSTTRSIGSSVSIRAVSSRSTVSGSVSSCSPWRAAHTSSRTKSGLPPARSTSELIVSSDNAASSATCECERGRSLDAEGLELEARDVLPLGGAARGAVAW